jgi:hypothetical protein
MSLAMNLSTDACKNLVDALQKLSLAATAVSVALLSNAFLAPDNIAEAADKELGQLKNIKEQAKDSSVSEVIKIGLGLEPPFVGLPQVVVFTAQFPKNPILGNVAFLATIPPIFYRTDAGTVWITRPENPPQAGKPSSSRLYDGAFQTRERFEIFSI